MQDVESFGYDVKLSKDGTTMAVASPAYDEGRGLLDVFNVETGWQVIGEPIIGELTGHQLGIGMDLSGDGKVVAIGLPGNKEGLVQVFTIDQVTGLS
jgi:hypothetical protein